MFYLLRIKVKIDNFSKKRKLKKEVDNIKSKCLSNKVEVPSQQMVAVAKGLIEELYKKNLGPESMLSEVSTESISIFFTVRGKILKVEFNREDMCTVIFNTALDNQVILLFNIYSKGVVKALVTAYIRVHSILTAISIIESKINVRDVKD